MTKKHNIEGKLRIILLVFLVLIVLLIISSNVKAETSQKDDEINTLIVETTDKSVLETYQNITDIKEILEGIYCVDYKNEKEAQKGLDELNQNTSVQNVCKDVKVSMLGNTVSSLTVNPERYAWGVESTGINHYLTKLKSKKDKKTVKIAVLDTGINTTHEAFYTDEGKSRLDLSYSYNYINNTNDITDDNIENKGHGTQVSGIIAQATPENVKIIPIKVLDNEGYGKLSDVLIAIKNIREHVDIINLSLGIEPSELDSDTLMKLEKVFKETYDMGVITVCAAGNDGENWVSYPACSQYTFAVSSINYNKQIASFSNYGDEIDFALPGTDLIVPANTGKSNYVGNSGTSFSSPFLSAAVALIKSDNYNYSIANIFNVLKENAEDLGTYGKDKYYGYGSLNFDISMFKKPTIENVRVSKSDNKVYVNAYSGSYLLKYAIKTADKTPTNSDWKSFEKISKDIYIGIDVSECGKYLVWVKNQDGYVASKAVLVDIFEDVNEGSWYYSAVKYVYENGIMTGGAKFEPNAKVTRGMLASIIYKMEGAPQVSGKPKFPDVQDSSKYYYKAVKWAADNRVVSGYSDGRFGPTDYVTREQLAVILHNYAKYKKKDVSKTIDLNEFADANKVGNYAKSSVKWAVATKVITGGVDKNTGKKILNPKGEATRAEIAAMIQKYCINVGR